MSGQCAQLVDGASDGVASALSAVDCMTGEVTASAFARLFGTNGALLPVLTSVLTLYIAVFALGLLTGRTRLGVSALTPRMLLVGVVLTFATSWVAYQQVLWNLAVGAPDEVASALIGVKGQASHLFAGRIDLLFQAIADAADAASQQQATSAGAGAGAGGVGAPAAAGMFAPSSLVWLAAVLLLLGTVGVLVTSRIVLAVLLVLGPVFIVLALLRGTRGLAAGWLRALVLVAVVPLLAVLGGSLTIELAVPVVRRLVGPEGIEARPAFALFLVASVHCALMIMALRTAGTIVGGWHVFGLARASHERGERVLGAPAASVRPVVMPAAPGPIVTSPIVIGRSVASGAAVEPATVQRTSRTIVGTPGISMPRADLPPLRTRGIGNAWRRPAPAEILR